mmetsp:Transcript_202/g.379  ORF Transcript_202/g.379 Transcript_202/m.379 type:complete len:154 (+) Transcript_202:314-775(+)
MHRNQRHLDHEDADQIQDQPWHRDNGKHHYNRHSHRHECQGNSVVGSSDDETREKEHNEAFRMSDHKYYYKYNTNSMKGNDSQSIPHKLTNKKHSYYHCNEMLVIRRHEREKRRVRHKRRRNKRRSTAAAIVASSAKGLVVDDADDLLNQLLV